jgi:hypothetical protein
MAMISISPYWQLFPSDTLPDNRARTIPISEDPTPESRRTRLKGGGIVVT